MSKVSKIRKDKITSANSPSLPYWKQVLVYFLIIICGIIAGFVSLLGAYSLPLEKMKGHVYESINQLMKEGDSPRWADGFIYSQGDQFTDAIMLKTAVIDTDLDLVKKSLLLPYVDSLPEIKTIIDTVGDEKVENHGIYPRYWGGYLTILKPLLLFFNISEIRIFSMFFLSTLSFVAIMLIQKRLGLFYSFSFFITVIFLNPVTIVLSLQYKNVFYNAVLSSIILLILDMRSKDDKYALIFLLSGMCVAFFDFLTYPILALCIPLSVYLLLHKTNIKEMFIQMLKRCILWSIGYGGMWMGKWVLAGLLTDQNVLDDGIKRVFYYASSDINGYNVRFSDVLHEVFALFDFPVFTFLSLILLLGLFLYLKKSGNIRFTMVCVPFLIIGCFPFVWYFCAKKHSIIHTQIVFRALGGTLFSLLCCTGLLSKKDNISQ